MVTRLLDRPTTSRHEVTSMSSSRASRTTAALSIAVAALLASGCGEDTPSADPSAAVSRQGAALTSGANCPETSTHAKHINRFQCSTCHPCGGALGFDVPYTFAGGTTTAGGTLVRKTATTPTSCTVACHYPKGAPAKPIAWDAPGPLACTECHATSALPQGHPTVSANATRADCQVCHLMSGHMDGAVAISGHGPEWTAPAAPTNEQFHAKFANSQLASCKSCHGQDLAGSAGAGGPCARCHDQNLPQGVASWKVNCVMCHGGTNDQTGAPPAATWGNASDAVRSGAHSKHVVAGALGPAVACATCHPNPTDALSSGHVDGGTAEVTFTGIAASGSPTWDRAVATCAVYCHGATLSAGGTRTAPSWTGGPVACGDCHGAPPPTGHPPAASLAACAGCHPDTVAANGTVIAASAGGKHLDGVVEAAGGHEAAWMDQASAGFHAPAANAGLAGCAVCHGDNLEGGGARACASCHDGAQARLWGCTTCHGGTQNATGAPPIATWGNNTPSGTTNVRIGAHTRHIAGNTMSTAFACNVCHVTPVPANLTVAGHADGGTAEVTFAGVARSGGASPVWTRISATSGTCASTYCHGATIPGGTAKTPNWTKVDGTQVGCGSCHGSPPDNGPPIAGASAHRRHNIVKLIACWKCHAGYDPIPAVKLVDKEHHVDGTRDVRVNACTLPCTMFDESAGVDVPASCNPATDPGCYCGPVPVPAYCTPGVDAGCVCQIRVLTGTASDGTGWNCGGCHALYPTQ
jgi:predicted CxxxxCH...CXXCH cytochrome family protein